MAPAPKPSTSTSSSSNTSTSTSSSTSRPLVFHMPNGPVIIQRENYLEEQRWRENLRKENEDRQRRLQPTWNSLVTTVTHPRILNAQFEESEGFQCTITPEVFNMGSRTRNEEFIKDKQDASSYPSFASLRSDLEGRDPFDIDGPLLADHVFEAPISALDELGTRPVDPSTGIPLTDEAIQTKLLEMEDRIVQYKNGLIDLEAGYRTGQISTREMFARRKSLDAVFNHSSIEDYEEGNFNGALKESAMRIMLGGFRDMEKEGLFEGYKFGGEEAEETERRLEDIRLAWAGKEGEGRWHEVVVDDSL